MHVLKKVIGIFVFFFKMDMNAVWMASEADLQNLALKEIGHIICLKSFCMPTNDRSPSTKQQLAHSVKSCGQERTANPKSNKRKNGQKIVYLGWMHYNKKKQKYVSVRLSNGGGVREKEFNSNDSIGEVLSGAKTLFFPNNKSCHGCVEEMNLNVGNYKGDVIENTDATLSQYVAENSLSKTRLYLLSRKISFLDYFNSEPTQDSSDDDFDSFPTFSSTREKVKTPQRAGFESNSSHSQLMGTSEERETLRAQTENVYNESLILDKAKAHQNESIFSLRSTRNAQAPIRYRHSIGSPTALNVETPAGSTSDDNTSISDENECEEKENIRQNRLSKVIPEPDLENDHSIISVLHPQLGLKRRIFSCTCTMKNVHDWIGSLAQDPVYFILFFMCSEEHVNLDSPVAEWHGVTLKLKKVDTAEKTDAKENKQNILADRVDCYQELDHLRIVESGKFVNTTHAVVSRENIYSDMIQLYRKRQTVASQLKLSFLGEEAVGDGVTRDAFSAFFQSLNEKMDGVFEKVPASNYDEEELEVVGKIITHAYILYNVFPVEICQSSIKYYILGTVRDEELLKSFMQFLPSMEAEYIYKYRNNEWQDTQPILDILSDYSIFTKPTCTNVLDLMTKAAKTALIKLPCFVMQSLVRGMGTFWQKVTIEMLDALYVCTIPCPENVIQNLVVDENNKQDAKITTWIHRYIRSCNKDELVRFIRFITGSSTFPPSSSIKLQFVDQDPSYLRPLVKTCFKILIIPRQYSSFTQLRENINMHMGNSENWSVFDQDL